jgi:hypothetical protein
MDTKSFLVCLAATSALPGIGWGDPFEQASDPAAMCRSLICTSYSSCNLGCSAPNNGLTSDIGASRFRATSGNWSIIDRARDDNIKIAIHTT